MSAVNDRRASGRRGGARSPLLLIGGQKCGSTTLADDLAKCRELHVELGQKEISPLLWHLPNRVWRWNYARVLARAEAGTMPVDVSSFYSMRQREAVDLDRLWSLTARPKVVYLVRERAARAISHHHHDLILGLVEADFDAAAAPDSDYVLNSCYGWQLEHWLTRLDLEDLLVIKFEDYIRDRVGTVAAICDFAGVSPAGSERIDPDSALNVSSNRAALPGPVQRVVAHPLYRRTIRSLIPQRFRHRLKSAVSVEAPERPAPPSAATLGVLAERFAEDQALLESLLPDAPCWTAASS